MHEDVRDLRHKIAEGKVLIIAGTGVSIAATSSEGCTKMENPNHPASWTGLLKAGVEYCYNNANYAELRPNLDWMRTGLDARQLPPELGAHDVEVYLLVAELLEKIIKMYALQDWNTWIKRTFGALQPLNTRLVEAIADLRCPIATTNYDTLIEQTTDRTPIAWSESHRDQEDVRAFKQSPDLEHILHLHGCWTDPTTLVFGVRSYERLLASKEFEEIIKALSSQYTWLFIGVGSGLSDPHFLRFKWWIHNILGGNSGPHYRLVADEDEKRGQIRP